MTTLRTKPVFMDTSTRDLEFSTSSADYSILGFTISPSQALQHGKKDDLDGDLISLLTSLTYHPQHIKKITLDLRYQTINDNSLAGKQLNILLLVRLDYDQDETDININEVALKFREDFYNLLALNLNPYEYRIGLLSSEVDSYINPFPISDLVEITRRIAQYKPFSFSRFQGRSPMSKVVDMLLREQGQCCLSILIEPHQMTENEQDKMAVFGYESKILPSNPDKDLIQGILGFQAQAQSMFSSFRLKTRLVSDKRVSQYLVNLVGSEISGQRDFFFFRPEKDKDLNAEISSFNEIEFVTSLSKIIKLEIPDVLLDLVYLFPASEAISAFRLPTERVSVSKERLFKTYFAPVSHLPMHGILIGTGEHPSHQGSIPIKIQPKDRKKHMYIVGKTGTGKSMMLLGMIKQDIQDNKGVCLIDPHGDLVEAVFSCIPENRKNDVYYFDPSDSEYVVGLNFIQATTDTNDNIKDYLVQEVLSMLLRTVDYDLGMFGPRAQEWTRMACSTLMALPSGGTLMEVPRLFSDKQFRRKVLEQVNDPLIKNWWETNIASQSDFHISEMLGYFSSKYTPLFSGPYVRNVVGQQSTGFDFKEIMDGEKILLINLSRGKIGQQNSSLLGSMFVSRLLLTSMARAWDPEENRKDFYLYVDEFQNFITDSFETILSEARKYGLVLIVANQHLAQLKAMGRLGDKIERAIFGNVATTVSFRLGTDAQKVADELGDPTDSATLRNLENRYAVAKMLVNDAPTAPFTMKTIDWVSPSHREVQIGKSIRENARRRGKPILEINEMITNRYAS